MLPFVLASVLSGVSVYAIDRIERMSQGPAPADHDLLRLVFRSCFLIIGIFTYAIIASQTGSLAAVLFLPVIVAALLAAAYVCRAYNLRTGAHLLKMRFDREVAQCSRAIKSDPANAAAHARLSELYEEAGQLELALEHVRILLVLEPSVQNRWRLAQLQRDATHSCYHS